MKTIPQRLAEALAAQEHQIQAAILLLDNGASVPFIARYRKEATGGLDDTQLRTLEERLRYLRELDERRQVILNSIQQQDKLTAALETTINEAETKTRLEDLYLPYKPKRRTKAQIAREAGLEPLATALLSQPELVPEHAAQAYINAKQGIDNTQHALEGARQILMEKYAEEAELLGQLRSYIWEHAVLTAKVVDGEQERGTKFADYFDYQENLKNIPSHRALALFRGRNEGILQLRLSIDNDTDKAPNYCERTIAHHFQIADQGRAADQWLLDTVRWAWRFKIRLHLDSELLMQVREAAETEAIKVFASIY
ncbi:MAG: Tex-like N-terminal domain-containing protein [Pseudomonadota bacterium]|nr:Tex-like N-terminal domain-containing protein [Pseudomonadota bacterium]